MYNEHINISPPYDLLVISLELWRVLGLSISLKKRLVMKDKIIERFELLTLVSIFISSVYAISPVV